MSLSDSLSDALGRIASAPILLVASDFDGTMAPIVARPADAKPDERSARSLRALASMDSTHGAIVSGRALATLRTLMPERGEIHLVGSHGAEMNGDPSLSSEQTASLTLVRQSAERLASQFPGLLVEHKPAGVAIHYRHAPPDAHEQVLGAIESISACAPCATLKHGLLVREIVVTHATKGTAIAWLRRRTGATAVVFIGDDTTDEDAFGTLDPHDLSIKVGEGQTLATLRIADTDAVADALEALAEARLRWLGSRSLVPINHHSILSDQRTIALVEPEARISWLCVPRIDSPAIFASLLGGDRAGSFDVAPEQPSDAASQAYIGDTFTLRTHIGAVEVIDYLDTTGGRPFQRAGRTDLIRVVSGTGRAVVRFAPRLDFGRIATTLRVREGGIEVVGSVDPLVLHAPGVEWELSQHGPHQTATAILDLDRGPVTLELRSGAASLRASTVPEPKRREATNESWSKWTEKLRIPALMPDLVKRSALVIKSLCYGPTGAISAAGTTSLPETLGGIRNWDYRFCWVRDAAWSASSLVKLGSTGHAMKLLDWLLGIVDDLDCPERIRPLYTVSGHDLGAEAEITDLAGYGDSRPVRVGNAANQQVQLDVFGTVGDLIASLAEAGAPLTPEHMRLLDAMVEAVARRWHEPDHGIWEIRDTPRHHVPSKVMCWNTVNRAIAARQIVDGVERESDLALRARIHADILANGFSQKLGGFSSAYESDEPDAACLLVPLTGFLPPSDPRIEGTIRAVERHLLDRGTVYRYLYDDGLPGIEGGFNICTGWLVESLALTGRDAESLDLLRHLASLAGPTGLLAEEHDPRTGRALGNFPQCYSHLAIINACCRLSSLHVIDGPARPA